MDHENLISREDDELVKSFNDLYFSAKLSVALSRTSLRHTHMGGIHEDRIAWFHRTTEQVAREAVNNWDDTDIRRFLGRG